MTTQKLLENKRILDATPQPCPIRILVEGYVEPCRYLEHEGPHGFWIEGELVEIQAHDLQVFSREDLRAAE